MLGAGQRPDLPAGQAIPVPEMENRIEIHIGHHVPLACFRIEREQHKLYVVVEEPVFQFTVERHDSGIIQVGLGERCWK